MAKEELNYEMIIIGGSAGSVNVLLKLIPQLPVNFPIPIVIVIHRKTNQEDLMVSLLNSKSNISVKEIESNTLIQPGVAYIAPADYHLLIENRKTFMLDDSEKINYSRPSIDVTMVSATHIFNHKILGILLTGANNDGSIGMKAIKDKGGTTIIQNPKTAESPFMPMSAEKSVKIDHILNIDNIAHFLINLS